VGRRGALTGEEAWERRTQAGDVGERLNHDQWSQEPLMTLSSLHETAVLRVLQLPLPPQMQLKVLMVPPEILRTQRSSANNAAGGLHLRCHMPSCALRIPLVFTTLRPVRPACTCYLRSRSFLICALTSSRFLWSRHSSRELSDGASLDQLSQMAPWFCT